MEGTPERKSVEERKELLARQIQGYVARGSYVESQSDFRAVLVTKVLGGLRKKREVIEVDESGNVGVRPM